MNIAGELGKAWPEVTQLLLKYYLENAKNKNLLWMNFKAHDLPLSLNHMYGRTKKGKTYLRKELLDYRALVIEVMGNKRWQWKPTGVTAAIILMESPHWVTKTRHVREMDADNKVKPIFDAVENATQVPDELHWQFHVFKIQSKWKRTTVYLFDLGDIVEYYY